MSRPSRGNRGTPRPSSTPVVCPNAGTTSITQNASDDWEIDFTWSPNVVVVTVAMDVQVNGGGWSQFDVEGPSGSPISTNQDPNNFGGVGDFVEFRARCTDVVGCGDFVCVAAGAFVT